MNSIFSPLLQEWLSRPLPQVIHRDQPVKLENIGLLGKALVVTGFRRTGKTYLLFDAISRLLATLPRQKVVYLNFEDERIPIQEDTLTQLLPQIEKAYGFLPDYLFLDELQNQPGWSKWLRRILDSSSIKIVVTGSSSQLSSFEIPTELRGRAWEQIVYPLSFPEFTRFQGPSFTDFLIYGGFPEVVLAPQEKKIELLQSYFQTVVKREILDRHHLKNEEPLKTVLKLLLNSTSVTVSKTYNDLKSLGLAIGKTTLNQYFSYFRDSYFTAEVSRLSASAKNRLLYSRKLYVIDSGFITALSARFSQNYGRLLENQIYWHLRRRDPDIFYYRHPHTGQEVDFVQDSRLYQVCYDLSDPDTFERETKSLIQAGKKLKVTNLNLVFHHPAILPLSPAITAIPATDFLSS
ncbi:hypothetical protein A2634_01790 [Candidatus Amesbacteria bacterium RIFCSPHIGHO2_01_FULL_48_32]|uniref:AAA family ATPase n=1 Tax=Candidatus Amesbacteria bacterium RIFCSPLOWO2_01_FULL_48_25 TaxID=1797259 RepID=A0A1F4ZB41_9BACT|nr:MAG: hypothetical protein A2634_01790 [Candidatus Amesbacteria bacterium RIFCSPHIGHO2_01_FULL_48_32]OGD03391.1 MAG: hypothetical protein A2989_00990 [Candidatus Amesbacteria bacterium RIFCSPLOWO2_01_FULL_48_25]HJZ05008.1 ATP-binding protein [Patescibacteria group bacterium]